jgi:hypothetical protein
MKGVKLASQAHIELYEQTARQFFRYVLDLDFGECLVTDESCLSDFSSCGIPDELADKATSLKELRAAWDAWVLAELRTRYGLDYPSTGIPLVALFRDIEHHLARRQH